MKNKEKILISVYDEELIKFDLTGVYNHATTYNLSMITASGNQYIWQDSIAGEEEEYIDLMYIILLS